MLLTAHSQFAKLIFLLKRPMRVASGRDEPTDAEPSWLSGQPDPGWSGPGCRFKWEQRCARLHKTTVSWRTATTSELRTRAALSFNARLLRRGHVTAGENICWSYRSVWGLVWFKHSFLSKWANSCKWMPQVCEITQKLISRTQNLWWKTADVNLCKRRRLCL